VVVEPGSGWPGDPADRSTPVAAAPVDVVRLAGNAPTLDRLTARISVCRACPRLVEWRERVATEKRASFRDEEYWGRPIAGWGPARARIAVVGLAPAAHGGNRTGRIFTGDRSGDWLFAALHRGGLARLPTSERADDRDTCRPWLERELDLLRPTLRVVIALGGFAWAALWPVLTDLGYDVPARGRTFAHLAEVVIDDLLVLASYHPSQQNTFTGRLTEPMLDAVIERATQWRATAR
jgi:uracil-DNA glycosylase